MNQPLRIVLKHSDSVDVQAAIGNQITELTHQFVRDVESKIGRRIDFYGSSPIALVPAAPITRVTLA